VSPGAAERLRACSYSPAPHCSEVAFRSPAWMLTGQERHVARRLVAEPRVAEPSVAEPRVVEPSVAEPRVVERRVAEPPVRSLEGGWESPTSSWTG
jgi:hypothetical protein